MPNTKVEACLISCNKTHDTPSSPRRCQSMSPLCKPDWMSLTFVRRRSQPIVLGSRSPCSDIGHRLFLDQTSWLRKERYGRSTERLLLRHSQRYGSLFVA